ncbi:MAG: hypothetical protein C4527_10210 [Candidatus Omnitrophota bacterium]|jgi:tetratricopeptide (TPR) repeat protein|nr:MAG: hypothetical protein C4527_10210 [Candidatus Omnitrophota bacterium]
MRSNKSSYKVLLFGIVFSIGIAPIVPAQDETPPLPPLMNTGSNNSLMDLLKADLLRRAKEVDKNDPSSKRRKPSRPRPELGQGESVAEPIDLSKYLGPAGDPQKTWEKLQELGKIPAPPQPPDATDPIQEMGNDMPPDKRMAYAEDLLKRRNYEKAQSELESILEMDLEKKEMVHALAMREKALFHRRFYDSVQSDFFRLNAYYPENKEIDELKQYLEEQSGVEPLKKAVFENPANPAAQRKLLDQYLKYGWLDFAEEFFAETIRDTSQATIQSLSEIFFRQQDYPMLIDLSRVGQKMYPAEAIYLYNEGVGHFSLKDPASLEQAKTAFVRAKARAQTEGMINKADWYLKRLTPAQR